MPHCVEKTDSKEWVPRKDLLRFAKKKGKTEVGRQEEGSTHAEVTPRGEEGGKTTFLIGCA